MPLALKRGGSERGNFILKCGLKMIRQGIKLMPLKRFRYCVRLFINFSYCIENSYSKRNGGQDMITTMTTKNGNISMDTEVIANYAGSAAVECFGVVGMASISMKDGLVRLLKGDNLTHGVGVKMHDGKIIIDFHIIVSYGVSIVTVAENLVSNVKYKVEEFTGLNVEKINIYVEGVRVID